MNTLFVMLFESVEDVISCNFNIPALLIAVRKTQFHLESKEYSKASNHRFQLREITIIR